MNEAEIQRMAKEAESGQGCALRAQLQTMPFEESLMTMRQIAKQVEQDRASTAGIPDVRYHVHGDNWHVSGQLYSPAYHWWENAQMLVRDNLALNDGTRRTAGSRQFECSDINLQK